MSGCPTLAGSPVKARECAYRMRTPRLLPRRTPLFIDTDRLTPPNMLKGCG